MGYQAFEVTTNSGLQHLHDKIRARRAAGNQYLRHCFFVLVFKKVNRRAQFPAKRRDERLKLRLDFTRHADLDAFRFRVTDAQPFGKAGGQAVTANFH